jgi:putative methyltransferase (TIGR04325 family)
MINKILYYLTPPLIPAIIRKVNRKKETLVVQSDTLQKYESFSEALLYCTDQAYEEKELTEVISLKTSAFANDLKKSVIPVWDVASYSLLSVVLSIIRKGSDEIKVLDFGGACGAHYFHIRALLPKEIRISWCVVETVGMVDFAKTHQNDELSFCSTLSNAISILGQPDLVHSSGTLQCVPDPYDCLNSLIETGAEHLFLSRLALNKHDRDVITIHTSHLSSNGIGPLPDGFTDKEIRYPFYFPSEEKFMNALLKKYTIIARTKDTSGMYPVDGEDITGYGLFCKRM